MSDLYHTTMNNEELSKDVSNFPTKENHVTENLDFTKGESEYDPTKISGVIDPISHLVYLAHYGYELPVTLNVQGAIISGTLVGRKRFLDKFSAQIRKLTENTILEMVQGFENYADIFNISEDEEDVWIEGLSPGNLQHIYLVNAEIVSAKNNESLINGIWCGDIASVDGFFLEDDNSI